MEAETRNAQEGSAGGSSEDPHHHAIGALARLDASGAAEAVQLGQLGLHPVPLQSQAFPQQLPLGPGGASVFQRAPVPQQQQQQLATQVHSLPPAPHSLSQQQQQQQQLASMAHLSIKAPGLQQPVPAPAALTSLAGPSQEHLGALPAAAHYAPYPPAQQLQQPQQFAGNLPPQMPAINAAFQAPLMMMHHAGAPAPGGVPAKDAAAAARAARQRKRKEMAAAAAERAAAAAASKAAAEAQALRGMYAAAPGHAGGLPLSGLLGPGAGLPPLPPSAAGAAGLEMEEGLGDMAGLEGPDGGGDERAQRRMIKNRESAARSRARRQEYTASLEQQVAQLREQNRDLRVRVVLAAAAPSDPHAGRLDGQVLRRTRTTPL